MAKAQKATEVAPEVTDPIIETPAEVAAPVVEEVKSAHYQEWEVKVVGGNAEKLKVSRKVVKISDEEAEVLNRGVLQGNNTYAKMYFKPE